MNPKTVIFDGDGMMYVMNEDSFLVSLTDVWPNDGIGMMEEEEKEEDTGKGR